MNTIEEQIAPYCTIPLPPKRLCQYQFCRTYLAQSNSDTVCYRHAQILATRKALSIYDKPIRKFAVIKSRSVTSERLCCVMGCETGITAYNRSGRCGTHNHVTRGQMLKDGSIARPLTEFSVRMRETWAKRKGMAA